MSNEDIQRLYKSLYFIRHFEEEVKRIYPSDKIKSPVHLSIGQEAVSVAVCDVLSEKDVVFGTYRGHALYLAKGGNPKSMMAELYGKVDGCGAGKAGSMHLIDMDAGMMGCSAIVGTTIPHAAGYALAEKIKGKNTIVGCFFGDGSTEEGAYHETVNFACLKNLPILFVCENNDFAIYTHIDRRQSNTDLSKKAESYGMPSLKVTSGDILEMREAAKKAYDYIRETGKPFFLEIYTQRWFDHVGPLEDTHLGYRTEELVQNWKKIDQVPALAKKIDDITRQRIEKEVEQEVAACIDYAEQSAFPTEKDLCTDVYAK